MDQYKTLNIYDMYPNRGKLELGMNTVDPTLSANVVNNTDLGNMFFNMLVGGSYQPFNQDNRINRRVGMSTGMGNMGINAMLDEYGKSANAYAGPLYANVTETENDELIKSLGLQGNNFNANITQTPENTRYGVQGLLSNMFGGNLSAEAFKDDNDKGLQFLFNKRF